MFVQFSKKVRALADEYRTRSMSFGRFAAVGLLGASLAFAFGDDQSTDGDGSGGDFSGNPIGTLPMRGADAGDFDQTITLRGDVQILRKALVTASGDGFVELIDLGDGSAWVRFYGDVRIELSRDFLPAVRVALFGGFEGSGMHYAVGGDHGTAAPRSLESGYEVQLDLGRAAQNGLLNDPLYLNAVHRAGQRTSTAFELGESGTVVIHQDV